MGQAQKKSAYVSGKVIDENEDPLQNVSVVILGRQTGIMTNDTGYFRLKVPAEKAFAIIFSYTGHREEQKISCSMKMKKNISPSGWKEEAQLHWKKSS